MGEVLDIYLSPIGHSEGERERWSTLAAGLRDARNVTGRNGATGEVTDKAHVVTWVGAMAYLTAAEQMGRAVRRTGLRPSRQARLDALRPRSASTPFLKSLMQFTKLSDRHIAALYGLRCAFVHSFGLVNQNQAHPQYQHRFVLGAGLGSLVRLPHTPWDGKFTPKRVGKSGVPVGTLVDVGLLGNTVEDMARLLRTLHERGRLEPIYGDEEFRQRFTMSY
jgi:hypothetical protein